MTVWSNNVNAAVAVGIASTDDTVYFAWQDTRAGNKETQSEDVYSASLHLDGLATAASQPPLLRWGQLAAGVVVGLGLAMLLMVALKAGGRRPAPASAP